MDIDIARLLESAELIHEKSGASLCRVTHAGQSMVLKLFASGPEATEVRAYELLQSLRVPTARGAYQLLIRLDRDRTITVGALGTFRFPAGCYVYTGSAMNGIEARVRRHLSNRKRIRWHVDFLLEHARIIRYAIRESSVREECELNARTLALPGASVPVKGFGSSDCRCVSHLVYFAHEPDI